MSDLYRSGLRVSRQEVIRRSRRLPVGGKVLVEPGDTVTPDQVIAQINPGGYMQYVDIPAQLDIMPDNLGRFIAVREGDRVEQGDLIASRPEPLGFFSKRVVSPMAGTIERVSRRTGRVTIRGLPVPIRAFIPGTVVSVKPEEEVVIETAGALVQGIFGIGPETTGILKVVSLNHHQTLSRSDLGLEFRGMILVCCFKVSLSAIEEAARLGVRAIICGSVDKQDLDRFLGEAIGTGTTGHEEIPLSLVITEGFGSLAMVPETIKLLQSLDGRRASLSGATQIRAGIVRPEVIVPNQLGPMDTTAGGGLDLRLASLREGSRVRVLQGKGFGQTGTVTEIFPGLVTNDVGARLRMAEVDLGGGNRIKVARTNLDLIPGQDPEGQTSEGQDLEGQGSENSGLKGDA